MSSHREDWSLSSNEAVKISIWSPGTGKEIAPDFPPTFTYPLFGEQQQIYGYKSLQVRLMFASDDMAPCVEATWDEKIPENGDVEAEDVCKPLAEVLPESAFSQDPASFLHALKSRQEPFVPPGVLNSTIEHDGRTFEVWRSSVDNKRCTTLLENMQILTLLYIEGGSTIDLDDEEWSNKRWEVFFLYEKLPDDIYSFVGYCTLYRYYFFNTRSANEARVRLSQFLILPPYQRQGHGSRFYDAILQHYLDSPEVREVTVEDPSEEFGDLRDIQDVRRLEKDPDFHNLKLSDVVTKKFPLKEVRERIKMPERQFHRCLEMKLLQGLNVRDKRAYKQYRLVVKGRIYKQQVDVLAQLDRLDRIDKVDETYHIVEDDYRRLLRIMKDGQSRAEEADDEGKTKRTVLESGESSRPSKRARFDVMAE